MTFHHAPEDGAQAFAQPLAAHNDMTEDLSDSVMQTLRASSAVARENEVVRGKRDGGSKASVKSRSTPGWSVRSIVGAETQQRQLEQSRGSQRSHAAMGRWMS